jgi:hypothetical protein
VRDYGIYLFRKKNLTFLFLVPKRRSISLVSYQSRPRRSLSISHLTAKSFAKISFSWGVRISGLIIAVVILMVSSPLFEEKLVLTLRSAYSATVSAFVTLGEFI